ncbi:MAG: hypothetical protein R2867_21595 [Caldilineaceae bacterium]
MGVINLALQWLGLPAINFLGRPDVFPSICCLVSVWQEQRLCGDCLPGGAGRG